MRKTLIWLLRIAVESNCLKIKSCGSIVLELRLRNMVNVSENVITGDEVGLMMDNRCEHRNH